MNDRKKIIIIEDDRDIVKLVKYNLEKLGMEVFEAYNGQEGLDLARGKSADLIILDLMLPQIDGYEVLKNLKEDKNITDIPVIILSAKVSAGAVIKGFQMGASDYIPKPFSIDELASKVKGLLEEKQRNIMQKMEAEHESYPAQNYRFNNKLILQDYRQRGQKS
jgi:DNA-binding response OmpR family regulator